MSHEMDCDNEIHIIKKQCFKLNMKILDMLNITHSENNIILWNKYQLFLYEDVDFNIVPFTFISDFIIEKIQCTNNHILCLDSSGNLQIAPLKFKSAVDKNLKPIFKQQSDDILSFLLLAIGDYLLCLHVINETYSIILNTSNFQFFKKYELRNIENIELAVDNIRELCLLKCHPINDINVESLTNIFKIKQVDITKSYFLVIICLDRRTVYSCIMNAASNENALNLTTLYVSPTHIADIEIIKDENFKILIALNSGTLIQLMYGSDSVPQIVHLNSSIQKLYYTKNNLLYSDSLNLWKIENAFSKKEICCKQLFVKQPRDFIKFKDHVICITYSNNVYKFLLDCDDCYISTKINEYSSLSDCFKSTELLVQEIMVEVRKNDEITNKINIEDNYTATIALANRNDILERVLKYSVILYNYYEEVAAEGIEMTLTNTINDYFSRDSVLVLITLEMLLEYQQKLKEIFNNLVGLLRLYVTFKTKDNLLKTTSITINEVHEKISFLIPITFSKELTEMDVEMKLVCPIPEAFDNRESIWTVVSEKRITLNSEHFITTENIVLRNNITCPREIEEQDIDTLLIKTAENRHGLLFDIMHATIEDYYKKYMYYVKLPEDYVTIFSNLSNFTTLNRVKAEFLATKLGSNEFVKLNHVVPIQVRATRVMLQIVSEDFYGCHLRVFGNDARTVFHMRNYFAKIFNRASNMESHSILQAQYTSLEDLKRKLTNLCTREPSEESISSIAEQFNKNTLSSFPL